ncbi:MAG TPA: hypothetical protein VF192_12520 [Longimicrobiales bacterium]
MVPRFVRPPSALVLVPLLLGAASACSPLNGADLDPHRPSSTLVYGEVRAIDARRNLIHVRERDGGTEIVRYDWRTEVRYGSRRYPISALDRGDLVRVRVRYDGRGRPWADRVDVVREYGRDRDRGYYGRVQRLDGRVGWVDTRRGYFTLERTRAPDVRVIVPRRLSRADQRRFARLRTGQRVRADVRLLSVNQAQLIRFR